MPVQRVCRPNHEFRGFGDRLKVVKIKSRTDYHHTSSNEAATLEISSQTGVLP